jgi:hypothetical protein
MGGVGSSKSKTDQITLWAGLKAVFYNFWMRATVNGDSDLLVLGFRKICVEHFDEFLTTVPIQTAMKLSYSNCSIPGCLAWGMSEECCLHCKVGLKITKSASATLSGADVKLFQTWQLLPANKSDQTKASFFKANPAVASRYAATTSAASNMSVAAFWEYLQDHQDTLKPYCTPVQSGAVRK